MQGFFNLLFQGGELFFDNEPDRCMINAKIAMNNDIPETNHPLPGNGRESCPYFIRDMRGRFTKDLEISDNRIFGFPGRASYSSKIRSFTYSSMERIASSISSNAMTGSRSDIDDIPFHRLKQPGPGEHATFQDEINGHGEPFFKILLQLYHIPTDGFIKIDDKIDIALFCLLISCIRPHNTDFAHPVLFLKYGEFGAQELDKRRKRWLRPSFFCMTGHSTV